jgi:UDP-N-acetyl-D-mannosaminuronate dehydrogenase
MKSNLLKIQSGEAVVGIVGLGYVGRPHEDTYGRKKPAAKSEDA